MIPALVVGLLLFGTLLWLVLLLGSTLFPPKRGREMRVTEKSLVLMSALLLVLWVVVMMTYAVGTA
ncbi:MAG TPA: hypothetical protein VF505_01380 [Thermoanaerobaculia bacterium]